MKQLEDGLPPQDDQSMPGKVGTKSWAGVSQGDQGDQLSYDSYSASRGQVRVVVHLRLFLCVSGRDRCFRHRCKHYLTHAQMHTQTGVHIYMYAHRKATSASHPVMAPL